MNTIVDEIKQEVLSWPNVTSGVHRFGGLEFRIGACEIGHLHGRHQVDIPFSARLRKELIASGKASPHHLYPKSGWISYYITATNTLMAELAQDWSKPEGSQLLQILFQDVLPKIG